MKPIRNAALALLLSLGTLGGVWAQSEASAAASLLPMASVVASAEVSGAAAGSVVAVPVALSTAGAVLVVKGVQASGRGTVYLLERASDGARASVEVAGRGVSAAGQAIGSTVTVSVIASGVLLSTAAEVIAFIPNAAGQALLHHERISR